MRKMLSHRNAHCPDPLSALAAAAAGAPDRVDEQIVDQVLITESPLRVKKVPASRNTASAAPPLELQSACWGAQLRGHANLCTEGFSGGTAHFKNKFCPACKTGTFEIPVSHVRAVPHTWNPDVASLEKLTLSNGHSIGFWKTPPNGEGRFRFVNNTLDCGGPQLVVFRELPSPRLAWGVLPENWVENGIVTLQVAKGTLVPRVQMRAPETGLWHGGDGHLNLSGGATGASACGAGPLLTVL